jgi:hypothetical protein
MFRFLQNFGLKDFATCFCAQQRFLIKDDIGRDFTAIASKPLKNHRPKASQRGANLFQRCV